MPRGPRTRPSYPLEVVNLIQTSVVDRRTLATIESPSQGDRAFAPTCKAEPIRVSATFAPKRDGRRGVATSRTPPMAKKIKKSKMATIKAAIKAAKETAKRAAKSDTEVERRVPLNSPFSF